MRTRARSIGWTTAVVTVAVTLMAMLAPAAIARRSIFSPRRPAHRDAGDVWVELQSKTLHLPGTPYGWRFTLTRFEPKGTPAGMWEPQRAGEPGRARRRAQGQPTARVVVRASRRRRHRAGRPARCPDRHGPARRVRHHRPAPARREPHHRRPSRVSQHGEGDRARIEPSRRVDWQLHRSTRRSTDPQVPDSVDFDGHRWRRVPRTRHRAPMPRRRRFPLHVAEDRDRLRGPRSRDAGRRQPAAVPPIPIRAGVPDDRRRGRPHLARRVGFRATSPTRSAATPSA